MHSSIASKMFYGAVVILLFAAFNNIHCEVYNTETFYIAAESTRILYKYNEEKYYVLNVGIPEVFVELIHGNHIRWNGKIGDCELKHSEHCFISAWMPYNYKALKVTNNNNLTAYVHYFGLTYDYSEYDDAPIKYIDVTKWSKTSISTGVTYVPFVGEILANAVEYFWPKQKDDVFDKILDKVSKLIDKKVRAAVYDLLNGDISHYRTRMSLFDYEIQNPNITESLKTHYVNIAEDLVGFEKKFVFQNSPDAVDTNFYLLPLYSNVITLKMTFYLYGIKNWEMLGLSVKEHVSRLKYYMFNLLYDQKGAINHVNSVIEKKIALAYDNTYPEHIFDTFANLRQFGALNGFEFLPVWKAMVTDPFATSKPEIPVVVFSTQFGRQTAEQSAQIIVPTVPLQPDVINGTLNVPTKVFIFTTSQNRIGGLKIIYANGDSAFTGPTHEGDHVECDLKGSDIESIEVRGTGQIDGMMIRLSDGREVSAGVSTGSFRKFSMENHRIVGIFMTNAYIRVPKEQAANIAVSYQAVTKQ